jgi:leucyl aminopeptidase
MINFTKKIDTEKKIIIPLFNTQIKNIHNSYFLGLEKNEREHILEILKSPIPKNGEIPIYINNKFILIYIFSNEKIEDHIEIQKKGEDIYPILEKYSITSISILKGSFIDNEKQWEIFIDGIFIGEYSFDIYKKKKTPTYKITIIDENKEPERINWQKGLKITKDLINMPPSVCTPKYIEKEINKYFKNVDNIEISVLEEKDLIKINANGMLGVGKSYPEESRMIIIEYNGDKNNDEKIGLVGKGVTYDTGGLSIKPSGYMKGMKKDLGGAATILGSLYALSSSKVNKNIVAVLPFVENLINEKSYKPDDILTMMNGVTVEITNTDAEGRLILADALVHIEKTYNPTCIIDIATLTGACVYSVGNEISAYFSTSNKLTNSIEKISEKTREPIWQLPLYKRYNKLMKSNVADIQNSSSSFKAGTIEAALFLKNFVSKNTPWIHMDIAYSSFDRKTDLATGKDVRLLYKLIKESL